MWRSTRKMGLCLQLFCDTYPKNGDFWDMTLLQQMSEYIFGPVITCKLTHQQQNVQFFLQWIIDNVLKIERAARCKAILVPAKIKSEFCPIKTTRRDNCFMGLCISNCDLRNKKKKVNYYPILLIICPHFHISLPEFDKR